MLERFINKAKQLDIWFEKTRKRDGRLEEFRADKIMFAIGNACKSIDKDLSDIFTTKVTQGTYLSTILKYLDEKVKVDKRQKHPNVEQIQDSIEETLIRFNQPEVAKEFILHRQQRTDIREAKSSLMEAVKEIIEEPHKDNSNTGRHPSARMLQIGEAASVKYHLDRMMPQRFSQAHREGRIHIHDASWPFTSNCLQIPFKELLINGFMTSLGGRIRPPKRIYSAFALAAIVIQANQVDQFGGQSYSHFDRDMAEVLRTNGINPDHNELYQGVEGFIYNLNSMHSRAGAQVPFSSINMGTDTTELGRAITLCTLYVLEKGMDGTTFIFPNTVFRLKKGINMEPGDPNYDLFEIACRVSARRFWPTYSFMDTSFNIDHADEASYMGSCQKDEVVTYKIDEDQYTESFCRMYDRVVGEEKQFGLSTYKEVSNVQIIDDGIFVGVKKVMKTKPNLPLLRFTTSNGRVLTITSDHPLPVRDKGKVRSDDISVGDMLQLDRKNISTGEYAEYSSGYYYLMGLLLTDGNYDNNITVCLGSDEKDIGDKLKEVCKSNNWKVSVYNYDRGAKGKYDTYNIMTGHNKSFRKVLTNYFGGRKKSERQIPNSLISNTAEVRIGFLAGMMDADGYINKARSRAQIGSTNKELALQTFYLAESLGMPAKVYLNRYSSEDKSKIRYRVEFCPSPDLISYMSSNKKKANYSYRGTLSSSEYVKVTKIENLGVLDENTYDVETETGYFTVSGIRSSNCRTRVLTNIFGEDKVDGRGNVSFTTINLPRVAIVMPETGTFFEHLGDIMDLAAEQLAFRFEMIGKMKKRDFPFMFGQNLYEGSKDLEDGDEIREALKNGTQSIGFVGLAEAVKILTSKHHGEDEGSLYVAEEIVKYMRKKVDSYIEKYNLNYSLMATPAETTAGRFARIDRDRFGNKKWINDKGYYTNSFHVPVDHKISVTEKISIEGRFHKYCNGGHISYVEFDSPPVDNVEAVMSVIKIMSENDIGYGAINYNVSECRACGTLIKEMK